MKKYISLIIIIGIIFFIGIIILLPQNAEYNVAENKRQMDLINTTSSSTKNFSHRISIETNYGEIIFETYDADAPKAVNNFITLAEKGFYNNLIFHRVIKDFMIQGGDPVGDGTGGPGYDFEDELNPNSISYQEGYKSGVVAMANRGPNTNGSQFFIMLKENPLPHAYTIFGKVISGQEVVEKIGLLSTDENDKPLNPVIMKKVTVTQIL